MAEDKKGFVLYADQKLIFEDLTNEEAGILIKHIFSYVNDEDPNLENRLLEMAFKPIKLQLKRDLVKYQSVKERNLANARKRWDAVASTGIPNNATASSGIPKDTRNADKDNDTVNGNGNDTDNDISFKRENLTESFLDDLENSTHLEVVCKRSGLDLETVKSKIPDFKKIASIEYAKPMDLVMHFVRWLNQNKSNIDKKEYTLYSPMGRWTGLLTEAELAAKTQTGYFQLTA